MTSILSKHFAACQLLRGRLLTGGEWGGIFGDYRTFQTVLQGQPLKMYFAALTRITPSTFLSSEQPQIVRVCGSYHFALKPQPDSPESWS